MFKEPITTTPLTGSFAGECFSGKIEAPAFRGDVSLCAAARALFHRRLKDGERIRILYTSLYYSQDFNVSSLKDAAKELANGELRIVSVSARKEDTGKWKDAATKALKGAGLCELEAIEKWFLSNDIQALVFTDKPHDPEIPKSPIDNQKTILVIENMTITRWHTVGGLLPRLLGEWFRRIALTDDERNNLCKGFVQETPELLQKAFQACADQLDFRGMSIRKQLDGFEQRFAKGRVEALERKAQDLDRRIREVSQSIGSLLRDKDEVLATLFGFQQQSETTEQTTMKFFLANRNLYLKAVADDFLEFYAISWLSNFDPDKAEATFGKGHCGNWLDIDGRYHVTHDDAMLLYKAIFLDETVKVRLWSHYRLYLRGNDPMSIIGGENPLPDITNALPNPHHQYHSCGGNNRQYVAQCIINRDIIGAIEQCLAATGGINLTEHASYQYFVRDLFNPEFGKVIYIKEKEEFVTTKDAIKWLKEKNGKKSKTPKTAEKEAK